MSRVKRARREAHRYFDRIWRNRLLSRNACYHALARWMKTPRSLCHIGLFSVEECEQVIEFAKRYQPILELGTVERVVYYPTADPSIWSKVTYTVDGRSGQRYIDARDVPHDIRFGKCQELTFSREEVVV